MICDDTVDSVQISFYILKHKIGSSLFAVLGVYQIISIHIHMFSVLLLLNFYQSYVCIVKNSIDAQNPNNTCLLKDFVFVA